MHRSRDRCRAALLGGLLLLPTGVVRADPGFADSSYGVGAAPRALVVADFDQDGRQDLAVANEGSANVSVLWGYGPVFAPAFSFVVGAGPVALVAADVDEDGYPDLVTANRDAGSVSVARGRGDGTFHPALGHALDAAARDVAVGDVDGDGLPDVVAARDDPLAPVVWLRGLGGGALDAPRVLGPGGAAARVAVLERDDAPGDAVAVVDPDARVLRLLAHDGAGGFAVLAELPTPAGPGALLVSDLDGDGADDLVLAAADDGVVACYRALGDGSFADGVETPAGVAPVALAVSDVQGDERADVVVAGADGALSWLAGTPDGGLLPGVPAAMTVAATDVASASLDGDVLADLVTIDAATDALTVHLNQAGPWIDLGQGLPGAHGPLVLSGAGATLPEADCVLHVAGGAGPGIVFGGFVAATQPFLGGTLVPAPQLQAPLGPGGTLPFRWPAGLPAGTSVYLQAWYAAPGPDAPASATNALRAISGGS